MVFMDPETGKLEELETLLSEWGIEFQRSTIRDFSNALDVNGRELVGEYTTEGTGASLTKNLRELESSPKAIFKNAMPINPTYKQNTDGTYTSCLRQQLTDFLSYLHHLVEKDGGSHSDRRRRGSRYQGRVQPYDRHR